MPLVMRAARQRNAQLTTPWCLPSLPRSHQQSLGWGLGPGQTSSSSRSRSNGAVTEWRPANLLGPLPPGLPTPNFASPAFSTSSACLGIQSLAVFWGNFAATGGQIYLPNLIICGLLATSTLQVSAAAIKPRQTAWLEHGSFPDEHQPSRPFVPRMPSPNESVPCLPRRLISIPGPGYTQPVRSHAGHPLDASASPTWSSRPRRGGREGSGDSGRSLWIPAMLPFFQMDQIKYHVKCPWSRREISYLPTLRLTSPFPRCCLVSLGDHLRPASSFALTQLRGIPNTGPPP